MAVAATASPTQLPLNGPWVSDEALFRRYDQGDLSARDVVAERYMPMAQRLVRRYPNSSHAREDLEQVAYVGLLKAVDRYEREAGSFKPFFISYVQGEIKRHFRDKGWAMKVSRSVQEHYLLVNGAIEALTGSSGRSPTPREIAVRTGLDLKQVIEALEAGEAYALGALDAPIRSTQEDGAGLTLGESIGREDPGYTLVELGADVAPAFRQLPEREQRILHMRFVRDLAQHEIAIQVGVSQMHVSRLIQRSLQTLSESVAARTG
jgi:RNA polymerase sigma-B factor